MHEKPKNRSQRDSTQVPVVIVGAGPVGLSLALGLARHGVRTVLFEKNAALSKHSKAAGVHLRTREIFQQWGIENRFLEKGILVPVIRQHDADPGRGLISEIDFSELGTEAARPGILMLEQSETERLLLDAMEETGLCDVRFNAEVVNLSANKDEATLTISESGREYTVNAEYVVGCDGAHSFVRKALKLPFEGITYALRPMLADVQVEDERDALPWPRIWNGNNGITAGLRLKSGLWRIIRLDETTRERVVPESEVAQRVEEVLGAGPVDIVWASRFKIHKRSSPRFRMGRVILAGDAAHVHSPAGGLGMNAGVHDAHNLAWKIAFALQGGDEDRLLDSYEVERRAVAVENVSHFADLITRLFLQTPALVRKVTFVLFRTALKIGPIRNKILRRLTMIDLDYPNSPILASRDRSSGVRLPNSLLKSPDGEKVRLYDLLPVGPALIHVADDNPSHEDLPVPKVIQIGPNGYRDLNGLITGLLSGDSGWILVRPDTHIAWAKNHLGNAREAILEALGFVTCAGQTYGDPDSFIHEISRIDNW